MDKLQAELTTQREKVEEGSRIQSRLKELKTRNEQIMEAKATLEDEVDNLQSKVSLLETMKSEAAQMKVQIDTLSSVSDIYILYVPVHALYCFMCTCDVHV